MDKEDVVNIYNGILLSHKKEQNNAICSDMDGPRDCHTKWSKSDTDKYDIAYMWNLKTGYKWKGKWKSLSHVQLFVTPWNTQAMELSRPEYWHG